MKDIEDELRRLELEELRLKEKLGLLSDSEKLRLRYNFVFIYLYLGNFKISSTYKIKRKERLKRML